MPAELVSQRVLHNWEICCQECDVVLDTISSTSVPPLDRAKYISLLSLFFFNIEDSFHVVRHHLDMSGLSERTLQTSQTALNSRRLILTA